MKDTTATMIDFYNGAHILKTIASWAHAIANRAEILEQLSSFERAYEHLVTLHAAGKLGVGGADFSNENLERVRRMVQLLTPILEKTQSSQEAHEIHELATESLRRLSRG